MILREDSRPGNALGVGDTKARKVGSGDLVPSLPSSLSQSARDTITKYHRLNALNIRNISPHSSEGWKFKVKVPEELVSPGISLFAHDLCSACMHSWCPCFSYKSPILLDQGPPLMISFNLYYLLKGLISKLSHIGTQGFKYKFWRGKFTPQLSFFHLISSSKFLCSPSFFSLTIFSQTLSLYFYQILQVFLPCDRP